MVFREGAHWFPRGQPVSVVVQWSELGWRAADLRGGLRDRSGQPNHGIHSWTQELIITAAAHIHWIEVYQSELLDSSRGIEGHRAVLWTLRYERSQAVVCLNVRIRTHEGNPSCLFVADLMCPSWT
jgi:hypothetical protein